MRNNFSGFEYHFIWNWLETNRIIWNKLICNNDSCSYYGKAFDWRGIEYSKKAFAFSNDVEGFAGFLKWISDIQKKNGKEIVIPGMEPTGHYWFDLALLLRDNGMKPVLVNPLHVKRSKELDDHLPSKNDKKDPKTIAKLIIEGRYAFPYLPEGFYAEIRNTSNMRFQIEAELTRNKNRIQRWFAFYFPEYTEVYGKIEVISSMMILRQAALPCDVINLGVEEINQIWREAKLRAVGKIEGTDPGRSCQAKHRLYRRPRYSKN